MVFEAVFSCVPGHLGGHEGDVGFGYLLGMASVNRGN
jgi:hypothetical protein